MEEETTPQEVQLLILKSTKSIQKNIRFIAWVLIISICISLYYLVKFFNETGAFRAY
jgi:hypothetical protein